MPNVFSPIGGNTSFNDALPAINANFSQLDQEAITKVFKNAAGKNGLITGRLPKDQGYGIILYDNDGKPAIIVNMDKDGNPSLKVAKSGYDVTLADNSQLIFNSSQDIFKIVKTGTVTIPAQTVAINSNYYDTVTIPHGLTNIPILQAYAQVEYYSVVGNVPPISVINAYVPLPYSGTWAPLTPPGVGWYYFQAGIDETNIYFTYWYQTTVSAGYTFPSVPIKYYLLQETAD